jgi:hypothetical protein
MEVQMRRKYIAMLVPAVFVASLVVSTSASARHIVTLSGTYSRSQVKKDCDAAGGAYIDSGGAGYACFSQSGNGNVVDCKNSGKCTGSIPRKGNPSHTLGGILRPPSAGIRSTGNNAPPKHHHHPVKFSGYKPPSGVKTMGGNKNKPVTITHNEEHHSGGHK